MIYEVKKYVDEEGMQVNHLISQDKTKSPDMFLGRVVLMAQTPNGQMIPQGDFEFKFPAKYATLQDCFDNFRTVADMALHAKQKQDMKQAVESRKQLVLPGSKGFNMIGGNNG